MLKTELDWMADTLYLHIGAPRTGSSAIQIMLNNNRDQLARHEVLVPLATEGKIVACLDSAWRRSKRQRKLGLISVSKVLAARKELSGSLAREVATYRPKSIVLSAEQLFERMSSQRYCIRLRRFLSRFSKKIMIIAYLRRQDQAIFSRHLNSVRIGGNPELIVEDKIQRQYMYFETLEVISKAFGRENVVAKPYEIEKLKDNSVCSDITCSIGLNNIDLELVPENNVSLDYIRAEFMKRVSCYIGDANQKDAFRDDINWIIDKVSGSWPKENLPLHEKDHILGLYEASNRRLSDRWSDGRDFFRSTSQDSSGTWHGKAMGVEDVVNIAAQLWIAKVEEVRWLKSELENR